MVAGVGDGLGDGGDDDGFDHLYGSGRWVGCTEVDVIKVLLASRVV